MLWRKTDKDFGEGKEYAKCLFIRFLAWAKAVKDLKYQRTEFR